MWWVKVEVLCGVRLDDELGLGKRKRKDSGCFLCEETMLVDYFDFFGVNNWLNDVDVSSSFSEAILQVKAHKSSCSQVRWALQITLKWISNSRYYLIWKYMVEVRRKLTEVNLSKPWNLLGPSWHRIHDGKLI